MSIGTTLNNQAILLAASILGLVAVPLALWLLITVLRLVGRVLGIRFSIPGVVWLLAIAAGLVAGSLAIDRDGVVRPAQVIDKSEHVVVDSAGGWTDNLTLTVRYSPVGRPLPPFTSTMTALLDAAEVQSPVELATLHTGAAEFDRLQPGDVLDVRVLRVGTLLSVVRPTNQTTWTLVPRDIAEDALAAAGLLYLAWRLRKTPVGYAIIAGLVIAAVATPLALAYKNWQANEDLAGATVHDSATVGAVTRVTTIEIGDRDEGREDVELLQPYDVVQLAFHPPDYPDAIVAVDAVDANEATSLATGTRVDVVYPPGSPRGARIPGQARTHYFKSTLTVYEHFAIYAGLIAVLAIIGGLISRAWRAWYPRDRLLAARQNYADMKRSGEWPGSEEKP